MIGLYEETQDKNPKIFFNIGCNACSMHFHRKLEILYVKKGEQVCIINDTVYTVKEKNMLIVDSFNTHAYEPFDGENIVIIIPKQLMVMYDRFMWNKTLKSNLCDNVNLCEKLYDVMMAIGKKKYKSMYELQAYVDYILSQLVEDIGYENKKIASDRDFAENVINYIQHHYKENITLESISKYFGYSKCYFSRIFNSTLGRNLNDYISLIRLEHTVFMIKSKKCSVLSAALENGFNSVQTFYRVYKKNYI